MILLMGVAGSGKSTQGKLLADELALPWLSTGEFLRMLISGDRRKDMLQGKLLGDNEIISLVQKIFNVVDTKHEFILDGFPRTGAQAEWLLSQAKHGQIRLTAVVNLQASREVVKGRLLSRGRQDDTDESINERFNEYERSTLPILEQFRSAGVAIIDANAEHDPSVVHAQIMESLDKVVNVH